MNEGNLRPGSDAWVAAIHGAQADRRPLGSGFLIDAQRVLTCAHVVFEGGQPRPEVWVAFPKAAGLGRGRRIQVQEVVAPVPELHDTDDVAVLILAESVPEECAARLRQPEIGSLAGRRWWAFGFPDGMLGDSADGVVGEELGYGWVRLDTNSRYKVKGGFSGAALWSPDYEAVVGVVGQARGATGDARAITVRAIAECLPGEKIGQLTDWTAEAAGESALSSWGWSLDEDVEAGRHWRPRARGVSSDVERGFRFRGRRAALEAVCDWLSGGQSRRRVMVVTGSPGVGKSAVLGRIVTTADPGIAAALPPEDDAVRAPVGSIACAVHAKGKTALEVAHEIARAASASLPERVDEFASGLRNALEGSRHTGFTVAIDALDEAVSPQQARHIIHHVAQPLAENLDHLGVRVVVGSRRRDDQGPLLEEFDNPWVIDLDTPEYFQHADLAAYALATLQLHGDKRHDNPYNAYEFADPVAERIAELAHPNFLVAGLVARAHGIHDQQPVPAEALTFTPTVDAALSQYLDLLPHVNGVPAVPLLTALAYAEAPGMPVDLWRTTIIALGHSAPTEQHLRVFARSSAANFLVETSTVQQEAPTFRLFHQALNEALLRHRDRLSDGKAIVAAFLHEGQKAGWEHAPAYLLRSLASHAARGQAMDDLLADDIFPLYADLRRLIPAATVAARTTRDQARLLRKTPRAIDATPAERVALYSISESLHGLGSTYRNLPHPAPYRARWASTQLHDEEVILEGHAGPVAALCTVPDGSGRTLLATASNDGTVRLWDPATGTAQHVLEGHTDWFQALCLVLDENGRTLLASASKNGTVRLWDPASGTHQQTLETHTSRIQALCAVPNGDGGALLATASHDGSIRLWDPNTGLHQRILKSHAGPVAALCTVPDGGGGTLLAAASHDGSIRLWDPVAGVHERVLEADSGAVAALCTVPDGGGGTLLAAASHDGSIRLWDPVAGVQQRVLEAHTGPVAALCTVPDSGGRTLLTSASHDGSIRLWDPIAGAHQRILEARNRPFLALCEVQDENGRVLLASASHDGTVRLWDPISSAHEEVPEAHTGRVTALCSVAGGRGGTLLATASEDHTVRLWDPATGAHQRILEGHVGPVAALCAVSDGSGRALLAAASDRAVHLWDPVAGAHQRILEGHMGPVTVLCTVSDGDGGTLLATASEDLTVRLWDPTTGTHRRIFDSHAGPIAALCAVPDGKGKIYLATASNDGMVRLWDPATRTLEEVIQAHPAWVQALYVVPNGNKHPLLGFVSYGGALTLWDPITRTPAVVLKAHPGRIRALCTVPDGNGQTLLATASAGRTVEIWGYDGSLRSVIPVYGQPCAMTSMSGLLLIALDAGVICVDVVPKV
ncbi:trypsin-like peptidase domain-containing protein [Streptomyces lavendofoliae]|uniref:trypsin-like peptidase domain-containing protein n=1 Tax=Streptomyces lavendofoliae TaxID=67314 RepID=UPI003D8D4666